MAAPANSPVRARPKLGEDITITRPQVSDGVACWRLAEATGVLDVNSRYAYLLWCRDFAATSVVARRDDDVVGFVTGFRRPDEPSTLVVWQVGVDAAVRGRGVASAMLDTLFDQVPDVDHLEATVTPDNTASAALFGGFAERRGAQLQRSELFGADLLGDGHAPEFLFRIGPVDR
ncbi:MAG TPA: diaminobutyrate acetyltransferase [Pseudonocardia sp.]|jgi:L-2,4-diaminobutyric acid acetyltransferase|uniref:diaminobutyrate acetyltransferase n=1 Tax=Pseudonocardia sp. TaxID=60912 RepID=UPI002B4B4BE4|nr:diaminobutyrate acetyltransferase [Pseudonocardia sp.]HLU55607.1 diaminobutyrate acetyltransferase [Pseudonocardia sp.]